MDVRVLTGARPEGRGSPQLAYGYVSLERPAPTSLTSPMWVIVPSHSAEIPILFAQWPQIHGATLPVAGTECLVGYDERTPGAPWLVTWIGPNA